MKELMLLLWTLALSLLTLYGLIWLVKTFWMMA